MSKFKGETLKKFKLEQEKINVIYNCTDLY